MPYVRRRWRVLGRRRRSRFRRPVYRKRRYGYRTYRRMGGRLYKRRRLSNRTLRRRSGAVVQTVTPFSPIMYTKFKCNDVWVWQVNYGDERYFVNFYANNPFDPVIGVSTSACSGFPALMQVYQQCTCFASKVVARFNVMSGHFGCVYVLMEDHFMYHAAGVTRDFLKENRRDAVSRNCYNYTNSAQGPCVLKMYRTTKALEQKKELEPTVYSCTRTSGPSVLTLAQVGALVAGSTGSNPGSYQVSVDITVTYYCKLFNRVNLDA